MKTLLHENHESASDEIKRFEFMLKESFRFVYGHLVNNRSAIGNSQIAALNSHSQKAKDIGRTLKKYDYNYDYDALRAIAEELDMSDYVKFFTDLEIIDKFDNSAHCVKTAIAFFDKFFTDEPLLQALLDKIESGRCEFKNLLNSKEMHYASNFLKLANRRKKAPASERRRLLEAALSFGDEPNISVLKINCAFSLSDSKTEGYRAIVSSMKQALLDYPKPLLHLREKCSKSPELAQAFAADFESMTESPASVTELCSIYSVDPKKISASRNVSSQSGSNLALHFNRAVFDGVIATGLVKSKDDAILKDYSFVMTFDSAERRDEACSVLRKFTDEIAQPLIDSGVEKGLNLGGRIMDYKKSVTDAFVKFFEKNRLESKLLDQAPHKAKPRKI